MNPASLLEQGFIRCYGRASIMNNKPAIHISHLTKTIGKSELLHDISLTL